MGHRFFTSKKRISFYMKINFVFANSADPDEMPNHHISSGAALFAKVPI